MADAKKCDRCGKLFEPYNYNIDAGYKVPSMYTSILVKNISLAKETYKELGEYDLCKECNDSFLEWLSKPNAVKHECLRFGNINKKSNKCKLCPSYQECKKATEEKEEKEEKKQKGCKAFGAFGGTPYCLMCPQWYECRDVANSINEANSDGDLEGGDANA